MSKVQVEQKIYEMPPRDGIYRRTFSHGGRHRAIGFDFTRRSSELAF